jgi:hypothetical protein
VRLFCVCVFLYIGRGLTIGWSPVEGVQSIVNRIRKLQSGQFPRKGCRFTDRMAYVTELVILRSVCNSLWIKVRMGGGVVGYFRYYGRIFTWGDWGKPRKPSVGITRLKADILKRGFLNKWWSRCITTIGYRYTPLHDKTLT